MVITTIMVRSVASDTVICCSKPCVRSTSEANPVTRNACSPVFGATGLHQLDWRARHACFGVFIGVKEEWGKGHGTDATRLMVRHAFATMNLNRVWLHVVSTHEAGIRAYERAGFRREGVLRQQFYREGRCQDLLVMAVLREEWAE